MANEKNVTNYEYQDLRDRIEERLRGKQGWGDSYESSVGQNLIDVAADAADILSYMLERRSQESFQSTARLRSSVATKSSELGYRSRRAVASSGTLNLQLTDENGNPKPVVAGGIVKISRGTEILFDDESFIVDGDYTIEEGVSNINISITQGVRESIVIDPLQEKTFIDNDYIVIPDYEYIDETSLRVISNNTEYQDVIVLDQENGVGIGSLSFAPARTGDEASAYYDVRYAQDGMRIQFGDNLFGMRPEAPIEISFIRTQADDVRVLTLDREFRFNFDVFGDGINVIPANEYEYVATNQSQIIGGRPPESLNDIRVNGPLFLTTNNRAVSLEGYSYWAKRSNVGGIIDARAYSETELNTLLYNMNNVYIAYLTETGSPLTPLQKQELIDFIKQRDVALAHIVPKPADEITVGLDVSLKRSSRLGIGDSELFQVVREFLVNYYARKNGSVGKEYQKSDLIRDFYNLQTRVAGVDFNVTDFVDIGIFAYQPIQIPANTSEYLVRLNRSTAVAGNTFSIGIDGVQYSVVVEQADIDTGDFSANMIYKMRDKLYLETEMISTVEIAGTDYILNVKSRDNLGNFILTADAGTFASDTTVNPNIQIYPRRFNNTFEDILLRGGVYITDSNNNVMYHDDGQGKWINTSTGTTVASSFDMIGYTSALVTLPQIAAGSYYLKYKQDRYENFAANSAAAVTLIEPKADFDEPVETFTTINLISD